MKNFNSLIVLSLLLVFSSCRRSGDSDYGNSSRNSGGNGGSGILTAGEWNDVENWEFWNQIINQAHFASQPHYWEIYLNNRVSILLHHNTIPISDANLELIKDGSPVWKAKTDNKGRAEMWLAFAQVGQLSNLTEYALSINGHIMDHDLRLFSQGVNAIEINPSPNYSEMVDLAFIVDATGSMRDEIEFLKDDLKNMVQRINSEKSEIQINTASVFYRDEGDDYVVKKSNFTKDINSTISFIKKQEADGGGDYPEAVHTALKTAVNELQWSVKAKSRIAFFLLDAPPHYNPEVIDQLQNSIQKAAELGIKIIPIVASGSDEDTEFLMRFMSIATNGTYVFLTDDSGVGNSHQAQNVGQYEVEFLNDLIVRLVKEFSD